ncbi:BspA family leucine-rich repeat surface protein [Limosilactobacillus reuteri]|uniref:MBG domain-containing protein n=1 Tax=Limosilactobacillus reuteri TaxID=1598 RepID=UPI001E6261B5|nr:MBG domain-containing protein [Limosilactobacillus reuteri]MCC4325106.1 BspA family leucine-rich repeat surface protein [Limosilactobacillus reuteri]MCC4328925.1 BspA family leucine-rich repeat surface protein [Limosilactobacillus reuteri]MCC4352517.1 BspA family leucine-rich repeat surface protein [Limosilactobacillus reuteri]
MGKNNPLRSMTPKNKNYKLYKAKKQWITACATFMLAFGATAVVNANVQADTTTPATTQVSGSNATESAQLKSSAAESAQNTDETKRNVVDNTTDTSKTGEQKTTTAQDTENSSSAFSANKTNSEEENKNAFLALNVNTVDAPANEALQENKITATATTNGGYDSATWGTLDTSKWTGQSTTFNGTDYYQLTGYTGDTTHIIVPNEADFAAAGTSTNGLQVAISNNLLNQWKNATTIAFSKTDDKKVKLASTNLNNTFQKNTTLTDLDANSLDTSSVISMQNTFNSASKLTSLTGISDWDVSNVTDMSALFQNATSLTSLTGLENWDVQKVTNMTRIFNNVSKVSDLSPLSNWKTDSLQKLNTAFANNSFTTLQGLENWNVSHVTDMGVIFMSDANLTDISALANWDTSNVTDLNRAFNINQSLTSLHGLENWNTSKVTNLYATFANEGSLVDASAIANWNTSNATNMSVLFAGSSAQYVDFSNWDFSKVTSASNVINNTKSVVYLGNNSTLTADKLNTLGIANGGFTQPIILASGNLYTLLSNKNNNTHNITINNAKGGQSTTISVPVVYDAAGASNMTDAINSYKNMIDQKLEDYVTEHNYVLKRVSSAPVDDVTGHNNHLVNYADATYQVVTIPTDQKKNLQIQDKTTYKGKTLTAKDLVTNVADFPSGTTFEFVDNSEPNWNQLGTYDVKVIATYPVSVNGQQYTAITTPATAKVTVTDQMQFTITYWDNTEKKELVQFDIQNPDNGGYSNNLKFPVDVNTRKYKSVSVTGVPDGVSFTASYGKPFTDPDCDWTVPNYKWDATAAPSLYGANIVIHLAHRTQDVTNTDPQAQATRTVTVNYIKTKVNEDGTYTEAGNAFTSAVLDVYYTRQATKDLVTGDITYGPWQWNTKKGDSSTPGYHVVSGTWTNLPQKWANVTADVPTLTGYTAYTGGPASNTNKIPANQFVFPTWNGSDGSTSDNSKGSSAYTTAVSLYEAQPVHTIFYVPNKTEARTITAKFVIAGGDKNGDSFRPDAQVQVFYAQTGTIDPTTNKVVYSGNWQWDQNEGDTANPGFHVISGSWNLPKSNQPFSVNVPDAGNDYVVVTIQLQGIYATNTFASPNFNPGIVFTNATDPTWYVRNDLTTYYVPKSLTEKTINRVINVTPPNQPGQPSVTQTITQSATLTRPVRVNADDSGVVFDGFTGSGWTTGQWGQFRNIPTPNNYTRIIKQVVTNPDGTTTETTLNLPFPKWIPAQTVNGDTPDTVINITYTTVATATLSGTNESTYTGNPITLNDLNNGNGPGDDPIYATVTGPTANLYSLQAGDVEFSSDNGQTWSIALPTNAGTYELRWTAQGKQNIIKAYGNNSIKWVDADGNSTITGTATYIISPKPITSVTISGNDQRKTYDGHEASLAVADLTISGNGTIANTPLSLTGLTASDFDWYDANGNKMATSPINAGTYEARLNSSALQTLKADNHNYSFDSVSSTIKYTINAAENTVSVDGTQTETYTGQPINVNYNPSGNNSVQVSISSKDGATASLSNVQLDSGDFQIVDISGNPITATNTGVYHIVLADAGVAKIQNVVGGNYKISQGTSFGTLVINKAQASAEFSGNNSSTYTGSANTDYLNGFSIKLNEPNNPTYNLVAGDIEFNVNGTWTTNVPINVGQYEVRLSQAGLDHIKEINSDNITWSATPVSGMGTYTITAATANAELSGHNSMSYNGNFVTTADLYTDGSTIKVSINGNNIVNLPTSFTLEDGDYTWNTQDGNAPVNAGKYTLTLSAAGLKKIQAAIDTAVGQDNVILSNDNTGSATFQIEQAVSPNVQLTGNEKSEYNGQAVSFDPTNEETKKNFGFNNVQGLTIPNLTADDFEWVDQDGNQISAPTNAGYYYLQLNEKGKSAFATANPNYTFVKDGNSTISGRITYQIYPASLIIGVTGTASEVYNGQDAAITQTQLDNGDIKLVWGNSTDEPSGLESFTLTPDDLEVVDSDGKPVSHANAQENDKTGNPTYYVRLTNSALNKIKALTGASNYDISLGDTTGNFLIYARKAQVTLSGNQTTTYGTDLDLDPSAYHIELTNWNSSVSVPTDAEIIQAIGGLKSGDVYISGFTNGQMPVNVGTYQVKIADQLLKRLQSAFPDYDWDAVSGTNSPGRSGSSDLYSGDGKHEPATYVITPADTTVTINGAEHIKYGENSTIQYGGENGYTITITAPVKNATIDNEHEPIYTNVKLEAGDLEFVTTPGNVGIYEVRLSPQGLKKFQALTGSTNYNWTQASAARANFFVDQMPVTITVGGNEQSVTYGSNEWLSAIKKNLQGYTLTVMTENDTTLNYQAKDGDLIFSQTPGNVGSYQVVLSSQGLDNIKSALGTNYAYPQAASDVTTYGTFNVSQGEVTISLDGSDSKIYDGKTTTPSDLNTGKYNLTYSATVYAPDGTAQTIQLTTDDLQFANGDPINAGSYTVELSPAGQAKLKNLTGNNGDNYKWTFNTTATYTINAATDASASLSGSNQKVFDGTVVTTAEINNGGDIIVNLTFPDSTENSIYHLQDGDYTWANGNAPTNAGTYTIELTSAGLAHLQAAIDQYAGKGNVIISADNVTGSATFKIVPKPITDVTISGKGQEKTYNGQEASLDVNDLSISGNDLVANTPLSMKDITASDFDWYDTDGNKLDAVPTDAGTYEARLKSSALQTLQKDNPNYSFNAASGTIKYTINQKAATDTLSGNDEKVYNGQGTTASDVLNSITWTPSGLVDGQSLDLADLTEADYAWYTKNADGTYTEMTSLPTDTGTYYLKLKDSSIAKIQAANPNYSFAADAISGEYTYVIKQAPAGGVLTGANSRAYNGQATTTAEVNSNGQIEVSVSFPGVTDANKTYLLKDGDYTWNTPDGSAPTNVGEYTITLTADGISNIKNYIISLAGRGQNDVPNVAFADDAFTGSAIYTINKAEATVTISGKVEQTYNGQALNDATIYGQIVWSAYDTTNDKSFTLTHDISTSDYSWYTKNGDQYVKFAGQPVNAGTYYLILNKDYTDKLNQENPNYDFTSVNGAFTYVINKATVTLNIAGSQSTDYNGQPVTIDYSNFPLSITTNNGVTVDLPAGVSLGADDVIITNAAGQVVAQPTAIGTYTITLTDNGLKKFASQTDNYDWTTAGSATLSITRNANVSVTLSGNEKVVYTGAVAVINPADFKITLGNGLTYELQAGDLQFVNTAAGANTNVGTYEVELSDQGRANIAKVQADNYGYDFSKAGLGTVTITKATPSAALSGDAEKSYDGTPISGYTPVVTITAPGNNSVSLTAGDYEWVKDGQTYPTAPSDAGTYTVQLTQSGIAKVKAVNVANLDWSNVQITGSGSYTINQANALITLPATSTQTIPWTGDLATIDPSNFIPEITTNNPNEKTIALPSTLQLTASDYEFLQDGKVISTPSEVGTYHVRLTQAGWQKVQNAIAGNNNYTWNYQGKGNYHIEKATASITLDGSASSIYTASPVVIPATNGVVNGISVKLSNGQTYVLKPEDLEFINEQGNQIPAPTNAGSYKVRLTEEALDQIRNLESNHYDYTYNNDAVAFTIEKASADVTTSGSYDVVYNGQTPEIKVDKIANAINTNNGVNLTAPTLSADDYEWVDKDGKVIANPVNVGTYYLKLKDSSQSKIATNNNYTWNFNGLASVTISKANATIGFNGSQETPYTGSVVALDPDKFEVKLSNGQTYQLTDKDIQVIGNPINVGTYQVELSQAGIAAIKAADSNYNYSYDGSKGSLTIVPAKATATLSGSQTTQDLEIDPSHYTVVVNGQTITGLTVSDFIFSKDGHPAQLTEAGTYDVELSGDAISKIRQENPNYNIDFISTATFTLENSSQTINYVDTDNQIISSTNISGHLKGTKLPFTPEIPAGWVASDPSSVPSEITLENGITTIKIKHGITNVDHTNPVPDGEKTVTGEVIDGAHENDLNQTITRTIVVTKPDGTKQTITQEGKIYRDATYDNVTGEVTYGEWSTAKWDAYTPETIPGYTVSESVVPEAEVKNGQQNETVNITYTANEQSGIISYQDKAGKEIGTTPLSGKTGETITITPKVPAGWQLVPAQGIPKTVTATAEGIPTIIVKVEHKTVVVTPETPAPDIPTGKVPGDPSKNYPIMEQLTVTPTRTINVKYPSGKEESIPQKVTFTRTAIFDEVTGEIKYTEWLPQGTVQWASYQPTTVTGYVPSQKIVPAMTVNPETPNETVDITYDKIPEPQEGQEIISYQDVNGQVIHTQTVTGEENSDVSFKPEVPTNWQPTAELPQSVKITGGTTVIVIEPVTAPVQEHKTVTRTIVEHLPSGDEQTMQTVVLIGTGTKNLVTGEVTDVKWNRGKFAAFTPTTVPGYTTNMSIVPEMDVTAASGDSNVEINYIPNEQTGMIIYRDANGSDISQTVLQGKTGATVEVNLTMPAGWQLVPGQSIPATVMATPDGIPDIVVLIKHQTIIVKPGEDAPTGKVPGNPSTTYEKMESLTKEVTRTIIVKLPDGQRQIITQAVNFTRTATFDAVTGKATYSAWQVDGSNEWPAYTAPEINGYTASQVSIPAEMVIPSDEDRSIEIEYTNNNQPAEPDKPITPEQPTTPPNPDQPVRPVQPAQPIEPLVPTNDGNKLVPDDQLPTKPLEQEKRQISNKHFVSHQLAQTRTEGKTKANVLPQTGNDQSSNSVLGFTFAALAGIFGLTGLKKKKREK